MRDLGKVALVISFENYKQDLESLDMLQLEQEIEEIS